MVQVLDSHALACARVPVLVTGCVVPNSGFHTLACVRVPVLVTVRVAQPLNWHAPALVAERVAQAQGFHDCHSLAGVHEGVLVVDVGAGMIQALRVARDREHCTSSSEMGV